MDANTHHKVVIYTHKRRRKNREETTKIPYSPSATLHFFLTNTTHDKARFSREPGGIMFSFFFFSIFSLESVEFC